MVDYSYAIPTALNWIAEAEHHPSPDQSGGIDYAAIYRSSQHRIIEMPMGFPKGQFRGTFLMCLER